VTYVIAEPCIGEKNASCVDVCPVACIHTTPDSAQYYIDPDVCIECEQCEIVCPVDAIYLDYKLPAEWRGYVEINAAFFRSHKAAVEPVAVEKAFAMIQAAQSYAASVGLQVAVAVVDAAGSPIAVSRMDGADDNSAEFAVNKAFTSASFWLPTHALNAEARRPWFRSLVVGSRGRVIAAPGGMPVLDGPVVIGAIGVAGGPNPDQEVLCCRAALGVLDAPGH
jgi:uncharacterized protein GlcG (DUF336 family)/NAD-dependent dihydropyrimidine dehydrogenase PreA subunit